MAIRTKASVDQELVEKARRGDNAAFGALWARHERRVVALCRRYLGSVRRDPGVDEQDLASDTFIRALHRLDRYEDRSADGVGFDAWLLEVARRICLEHLAKQRRRGQWSAPLSSVEGLSTFPAATPAVEQVAHERALLRAAAEAVNALPDLYRIPFKLFLEEYPQKEIAAALGISVENAAKRVQRARQRLQSRLALLFDFSTMEQALAERVGNHRIVTLTTADGAEFQLCLRVNPELANRAAEIEASRIRLQRRPRAWKMRLELADLCYHSGEWTEALRTYRDVLAVNPGCVDASLRLGAMLAREERLPEAAEVYRAALRQEPPPPMAARLEALLLAAQGRDREAVKAFRHAIALAPRERANYYGLHEALGRLSRYEEQLTNLNRLRARDPQDRVALVGAYTPSARLGRFAAALPLLERAVALDSNDPMAVKALFQARMNLGLHDDETRRWAERLVQLAPEFVASWSELSWASMELGRDEESLAVMRRFLEEHPQNAEAYATLAWRYHYLQRGDECLTAARRAYALDPQNWFVCWTLCVAYHSPESDIPEAEVWRCAEKIAARFPCDAHLLHTVGTLYARRGREAEALRLTQRAVRLSPTSAEAQEALADAYHRFGRWPEAAEAYRQLAEMPGGMAIIGLCGQAEALRALGAPRAEERFAEAAARAAEAGDAMVCARVYEAWERLEEAIAAYRRALARSPLPTYVRLRAEAGLRRLGKSP